MKSLLALLMVVSLDAAGMGIFFPILNTLLLTPEQSILPFHMGIPIRQFYYGITVGLFFFSWFIGATYVSSASDCFGRKKALLVCLSGLFLGYSLIIVAIVWRSLSLLMISRVIAGLTAGSQPVAQAAAIDISPPEKKPQRLGLVMVAFSLGMIVGPLIGGFFSNTHIISWFSLELPFIIMLVLIAINSLLIALYYQESLPAKKTFYLQPLAIFHQFKKAIKLPKVRKLSLVFFIMQCGFNTVYVFIPVYLYRRYQFTTLKNSLIMFFWGISMAISCGFLVRYLSNRSTPKRLINTSLIIMAMALGLLLTVTNKIIPYFAVIIFMMAFGVAYTNMLGLFSNSVDESQQGWVMGITVSLFTLGTTLMSYIGIHLINISLYLPFLLAIMELVISAILLSIFSSI